MKKICYVVTVILIFTMMLAFSACKSEGDDKKPTVAAVTTVAADLTGNSDVVSDTATEALSDASSDDNSIAQNTSDVSEKTNTDNNNKNGATNASFDDTKATEKPSTTSKYTMPAYTVGGPGNDPYVEDIF